MGPLFLLLLNMKLEYEYEYENNLTHVRILVYFQHPYSYACSIPFRSISFRSISTINLGNLNWQQFKIFRFCFKRLKKTGEKDVSMTPCHNFWAKMDKGLSNRGILISRAKHK